MNQWDEVPGYPSRDWKYEVANDDTRLGYLDWAAHQRELDLERVEVGHRVEGE